MNKNSTFVFADSNTPLVGYLKLAGHNVLSLSEVSVLEGQIGDLGAREHYSYVAHRGEEVRGDVLFVGCQRPDPRPFFRQKVKGVGYPSLLEAVTGLSDISRRKFEELIAEKEGLNI